MKFILGRKLDVEMSGGRKGNSNRSANITTTKLHVAGVGMNPNIDEVKRLFEEYGTVREGQGKNDLIRYYRALHYVAYIMYIILFLQ